MMTRKYTRLRTLILLCLWGCCCTIKAQTSGIAVTLIDYNIDTNTREINLGYTLNLNAEVTNYSTQSFTDTLDFAMRDSFHVFTTSSVFSKPPYSGRQLFLDAHETVPAVFGVYVNPQYFSPGPDVVVVWPLCNAPALDSIILHIKILDPSAINDPGQGTFTYAVMHGKILFRSAGADMGFEQVRIYDILGRQVTSAVGDNVGEISIDHLPQGVYTCQLITTTGKRTTFKFLNQ